MERKWSESAVRWALQAAIEGATPGVAGALLESTGGTGVPRELVECGTDPPPPPRGRRV